MSFPKKLVTTYAKSLFLNVKNSSPLEEKRVFFDVTNVSSYLSKAEERKFVPDVYIIGEELILLSSAMLSSTKLKGFFQNPTFSEKQKLEILNTVFPGLTIPLKAFLKVLVERSHLSLIPEISEEYMDMVLKFRNSTKVKLLIATGLKETYGTLLLSTLRALTSCKEILLNVFYNPKLLGGLVIEYNSMSIDASILKEFSLFFNEL